MGYGSDPELQIDDDQEDYIFEKERKDFTLPNLLRTNSVSQSMINEELIRHSRIILPGNLVANQSVDWKVTKELISQITLKVINTSTEDINSNSFHIHLKTTMVSGIAPWKAS